MRGQPVYSALDKMDLEIEAEVQQEGSWKSLNDAGLGKGVSWSSERIDLTSLTDVARFRVKFVATSSTDEVLKAYGPENFPRNFKFVVRNWNLASRTRRLHENGKIVFVEKKGKSPSKITCSLTMEIDLSEFSGEIELQPLMIATKAMKDKVVSKYGREVVLHKAGILGWTDSLTVILDKNRSGIDSLFEYRWVSFKDDGVPGVSEREFFAVRWESRPILYLNKDVDGLEMVLTCEDKTGKRARARDQINSMIAHQVLTVAIATSIYAAREVKLRLGPTDGDAATVVGELSPLERDVLRTWVHAVDPVVPKGKGKVSEDELVQSIERLVSMDEDEVQRAISEYLPQVLQADLGSIKAADELLKTFTERGDS